MKKFIISLSSLTDGSNRKENHLPVLVMSPNGYQIAINW